MIFNNLMMSAATGFALIGLLQSPAIQSAASTPQAGDISKARREIYLS